jgi:hypothetical protein
MATFNFSKFECPSDIEEAYIGTKNALMRGSHRPLEQKYRAIDFLIACIEEGHVQDPGGRTMKWLKSMTKGECS